MCAFYLGADHPLPENPTRQQLLDCAADTLSTPNCQPDCVGCDYERAESLSLITVALAGLDNQLCNQCHGEQIMATADEHFWEACPACRGTGVQAGYSPLRPSGASAQTPALTVTSQTVEPVSNISAASSARSR